MQPFRQHTGQVAPLDRADVDTDQIIPKQFLKRIERSGYGEFLFHDWRYTPAGGPDPRFVLNAPRYRGASILVAGRNFGCGSSREHAVWALADYGFRAIIAPSFADIFANNCTKNGVVPVALPADEVLELMQRSKGQPAYQATVDLESLEVRDASGFHARFTMDDFQRHCLMQGLDEIGLTLQHESEISRFESRRR